MAVVIELRGLVVDNPFVDRVWDIDFAAGGAPDMVFTAEQEGPVAQYSDYNQLYRYWSAQFTPPVAWTSIEGKNAASLFESGITILGSGYADRLLMTDFAEQVSTDSGDDVVDGRGGDDHLLGGWGDDVLSGGDDDDTLVGGDERDRLAGGPGDDIMTGNGETFADADAFVFDAPLVVAGVDRITDFAGKADYGERDRILLDLDVFASLPGVGKLKAKFFDIGNRKADDGNDFLIYHKKSGGLFYDADASKKGDAPVQFAVLDDRPKLSHKDFAIFDDA